MPRMMTTNWGSPVAVRLYISAASTSGSTSSSSTSIRRPATERTAPSDMRSVRSMRSIGKANGASATSTWRAETIASVNGSRICATVPTPGSESIRTSPPS